MLELKKIKKCFLNDRPKNLSVYLNFEIEKKRKKKEKW